MDGGSPGASTSAAPHRPLFDRIRNAVPRGVKQGAFNALTRNPLIGRMALGKDNVVVSHGLRFDLSGGNEHRAAAIRLGLYERAERYMVRHYYLGIHDTIELGASLGVISCELARRRHPGIRQISVEPDPRLAERAERNLRLNGFDDVIVERAAIVHSGEKEVRFTADRGLGGQVSDSGTVVVRGTTLGEIAAKHGIDRFDLVMDVEGAEEGVLLNERAVLARCHRILIEFDAGRLAGTDESDPFVSLGFRTLYAHESCAVFERMPTR